MTTLKFGQPLNALSPISTRLDGNLMRFNDVQLLNAPSSIFCSPSLNVISLKLRQPLNALSLISTNVNGNVMRSNDEQLRNAYGAL